MPLVIDNPSAETCSLGECTAALDAIDFNPEDTASTEAAAGWLRRLANNRDFLGDLLVDRLAGRGGDEIASGYGPQAIILSRSRSARAGSAFLRAAIWPSPRDCVFQTSGAASFVYGAAHDHNFDFLTVGYCGPGYASDYYEYDYAEVAGYPGEDAGLRFVERSTLSPGKLVLYRKHRDVHSQLPPESLSVSLNVMRIDPAQGWFDQYGFDLERGTVARLLNPHATEAFLRVAVASGADSALEFAEWAGAAHPSDRIRLASFEARADLLDDPADEDALWRAGELSGSRMVAGAARARRAAL
ncbi:transposase [Erythrobacter sp.]|uniref:transposase n=1 Tax=Erythrobacter sp. TaxID=1042 RepID=UPI0025E79EA4|nr:transposase [Erythrobacter sp.]